MKKSILSTADIAAERGVQVRTVENWIRLGLNGVKLKASRFGRLYSIEPKHWEEFKARVTTAA